MLQDLEQTHTTRRASNSIGRIVSVTGSQAVVELQQSSTEFSTGLTSRPEMGTLLKVDTPKSVVLGLISALSVPVPAHGEAEGEIWIAELELVGELKKERDGAILKFQRGVSSHPVIGDSVFIATRQELERVYASNDHSAVAIGKIRQDRSIPAMLSVDELLGKHFAVLGSTGTGKSCTVALILRAILQDNPQAHMVLLDPHNEYATCFGTKAEIITPNDLNLPFWLLTFEELTEILIGDKQGKSDQIEILAELIPVAKSMYSTHRAGHASAIVKRTTEDSAELSVDTPTPYRISDLLQLLNDRMGRLEHKKDSFPHLQLKARIESVTQDRRYAFMFGSLTVQDLMADVLGRLLRIPVNDKPLSIIELTGLPSEVVNVVVSVLCRMIFDFALWSEGMVPVTLICEEAHRYIPTDPKLGFEPTRRAIARIAKEGRKYGVSLCIVSQRPSELDPTILSQCNTLFAMRLSNDHDQKIVSSAVADSASGLLEFLPSLAMREAIAFGDGVTLPARIHLNELPENAMPKSGTAQFTRKWREQIEDTDFLTAVVKRWRTSGTPKSTEQSRVDEAHQQVSAPANNMAPAQADMPPGHHPAEHMHPQQMVSPEPNPNSNIQAAGRGSIRRKPVADALAQPSLRKRPIQ